MLVYTEYCIPLLIQQHIDGADVFNRSWAEYKVGFNDSKGNFWVGNELLHQLTKDGRYKLKCDMFTRKGKGRWHWADYSTFVVFSEDTKYMMLVGGYLYGGWRDALVFHNGARFSTYDSDNDINCEKNCAAAMGAGFWWNEGCLKEYCGANTALGSTGDFRWVHRHASYSVAISQMWLTC